MSDLRAPRFLLEERGIFSGDFSAFVVGVAFDLAGKKCGFGLGDGTMRLIAIADPATPNEIAAHDGAILSFASDGADGFVSGGDDGAFQHIGPDGSVRNLQKFGMKWVEHVAAHRDERGQGAMACAVGKTVHVFGADGAPLKKLDHPSSVSGLVFDAKGKRIAASHYNGASLWYVAAKVDSPRKLEWKGSHTGIILSPDGDAVVTSMQENALHGWRLSDGQHMRMSGYPAKTQSMSFSRNGKWLGTSGADCIVAWPFFGGGPMGKAPTELAGGDGVQCTSVAFHPQQETCAGGFSDGLVVLADVGSSRILPIAPPGHGPVSAMTWSPDGTILAVGTETGFAALIDFSRR